MSDFEKGIEAAAQYLHDQRADECPGKFPHQIDVCPWNLRTSFRRWGRAAVEAFLTEQSTRHTKQINWDTTVIHVDEPGEYVVVRRIDQ